MKLMSMTDFVLEQNEKLKKDVYTPEHFSSIIICYARFLKQPLKLEMFVCVDDEGNVLEEPEMQLRQISFDEWEDYYDDKEVEQYRKAREKVLFEGFGIRNDIQGVANAEAQVLLHIPFIHRLCVEDLLNISNGNLTLTESAKKQIGL